MGRLERQQDDASLWWSLGRIGTRAPVYGPLNHVVPASRVAKWIERIEAFKRLPAEAYAAVADLTALTGDGARDVSDETRARAAHLLREHGASEALVARLFEPQVASRADLQRRYGESLPEGLALAGDAGKA